MPKDNTPIDITKRRKGGRPPANIDRKQFQSLCGLQCTKLEICAFFDITDKTLEKWCKREYKMGFSEVFAQKRGTGKIALRRSQFRLAEKNAAMAIWLGKQHLEQSDDGGKKAALASEVEDLSILADMLRGKRDDTTDE